MRLAAPWLLRIGAVLILVSPFLPQADVRSLAPSVAVGSGLPMPLTAVPRAAVGVGLHLPVLVGAVLLAGALRRGGGPPALRVATLGLLILVSFGLATVGSLLLTQASGRTVTPSFAVSVALFAAPLALSGIAVSRWMESGVDRSTGTFERASLALLMGLHGLLLVDFGWQLLWETAGGQNGTVRLLPGVAVEPVGALLAAAGSFFVSLAPRAAVDTAAASG